MLRGRPGAKLREKLQAEKARRALSEPTVFEYVDELLSEINQENVSGYKTRAGQDQYFLKPLAGKKPRLIAPVTWDIESKKDWTQEMGLTRPFRVGFYDGTEYRCFRNEVFQCASSPTPKCSLLPKRKTGSGSQRSGSLRSRPRSVGQRSARPARQSEAQQSTCLAASALFTVSTLRMPTVVSESAKQRTFSLKLSTCNEARRSNAGGVSTFSAPSTPDRECVYDKMPCEPGIQRRNRYRHGLPSSPCDWQRRRWIPGSCAGDALRCNRPNGAEHPPLFRCADDWPEWHLRPGQGCIDRFARFVFGQVGDKKKHRARYQRKQAQIYGHNAGKFDMLFLLGWLLRHRDEFEFEIVSVQSRIQQLIVWRRGETKKRAWIFLDSVSLLPMTLDKVGKTFISNPSGSLEQPATAAPQDLNNRKLHINLNLHESDAQWDEYLKTDCVVLRKGLLSYEKMILALGGEVGITAPATAMKLFRMAFQKTWIAINAHLGNCTGKCEAKGKLDEHGHPAGCSRDSLCSGACHGCLHEFVRLGYYGGRTELFRSWVRNAFYFDINSSYPASMREEMPIGPVTDFGESSWAFCAQMRKTHIGFVEAEVEIPEGTKIPPLPWRVPEGANIHFRQPDGTDTVVPPGKLIFPTGRLRGVWDFDELALVLHPHVKGRIVKIHRSVWFKSGRIFDDFVDVLYSYRSKDDPNNYSSGQIQYRCTLCCAERTIVAAERTKFSCFDCGGKKGEVLNEDEFNGALAETCKLMLNSLYGKFGMREERTGLQLVFNPECGPSVWPEHGWPIDGEHDTCLVWEVEKVCQAPYIIPQISAHITALSRIRLFHGMIDVVAQGGCVVYVDTDSIVCDKRIPCSAGLGGWKLETPPDHMISGTFILPKLYQLQYHSLDCQWNTYGLGEECLGCSRNLGFLKKAGIKGVTKEKMKGVGSRSQNPKNFDVMTKQKGVVSFERLSQHRAILNASRNALLIDEPNHSEHGGMLSPRTVIATKSVRTQYDKRTLQYDGSTVAIHIAA